MKILLTIHEELNPDSGAAGSTFRIGQEYLELGHDVVYFSFNDLPAWMPLYVRDLLFPEFVASYFLNNGTSQKFDVIDASTGDAWFWATFFRENHSSSPLLVARSHYLEHLEHQQCMEESQLGNISLSWKYPLYRGSIKLREVAASLKKSDLTFVLNQYEKDYAVENFDVAPNTIHIVNNGISNAFLNAQFIPLPNKDTPYLSIAIVGTYILRKGIQYSVPALRTILKLHPHIEVSFLGTECPESDVYKDFDATFHHRIHVTPHYEHSSLPLLLKDHHISLLTSNYEAFGKALVETMACGLAPIATATSGPQKILSDQRDGLLVPVRDSQAIETALTHLISDRSFLEKIRSEAYTTAQNYSWTLTAQDRIAQYEKYLHI